MKRNINKKLLTKINKLSKINIAKVEGYIDSLNDK